MGGVDSGGVSLSGSCPKSQLNCMEPTERVGSRILLEFPNIMATEGARNSRKGAETSSMREPSETLDTIFQASQPSFRPSRGRQATREMR